MPSRRVILGVQTRLGIVGETVAKSNPDFSANLDTAFYVKEASKHKILTRDEEIALARASKGSGEEARRAKEELFLRNMRLVMAAARSLGKSVAFHADLIQEGSIGLMRAIEKFDPEKGYRFATYAPWWIRQAIIRYSHTSDEIRLPSHVAANKSLLSRVMQKNPNLTDSELQYITGFSETVLKRLKRLPKAEISLDDKTYDDADLTLGETLSDPEALSVFDSCQKEETLEILREVLNTFPDREREIFWAWVSERHSLRSIGERWGISRERVRQILAIVTNKVKAQVGTPVPKKRPVKRKRTLKVKKPE